MLHFSTLCSVYFEVLVTLVLLINRWAIYNELTVAIYYCLCSLFLLSCICYLSVVVSISESSFTISLVFLFQKLFTSCSSINISLTDLFIHIYITPFPPSFMFACLSVSISLIITYTHIHTQSLTHVHTNTVTQALSNQLHECANPFPSFLSLLQV